MTEKTDRDYVLGTHDEEVARLGQQHRVWRPTVLECWREAGISAGSRVLDVGAGPGYATLDLAEIVGPRGEVVAIERSANFVRAAEAACGQRGLTHVRIHELDLMASTIPAKDMDAAWCRWVASFVPSPATLVEKIAASLKPGGIAIFHEYADYASWRLAPPCPAHADFVQHVIASWRANGGEPDIAPKLLGLLTDRGFEIHHAIPRVFCARPNDPFWQWPAAFLDVNLARLQQLGRVNAAWAESVRAEFRSAEANPNAFMITPMVLEIVASKQLAAR